MRPRGSHIPGFVMAAAFMATAAPQNPPETIIESSGKASVAAIPDAVEFKLTFQRDGATYEEAAAQAAAIPKTVDDALEGSGIGVLSVDGGGPRIAGVDAAAADVVFTVVLPLGHATEKEGRAEAYGGLVDGFLAAIRPLGCAIEGPRLFVRTPDRTEQEAVARATENALYKADAVATIMRTNIVAVHQVQVEETSWDHEGATVERIVCTARVRVQYRAPF